MRNILLATDLSSRCDHALARAAKLAQETSARLHVLHVLGKDLPAADSKEAKIAAEKKIQQKLARRKQGLKKFDINVRTGEDYLTIIKQATRVKADVIVTGVHNKPGIKKLFVGTTAERLLRFSPKPVLVVKNPPRKTYKKIVVAMDFSEPSVKALENALLLFPDSSVSIVHAYSVPFKGLIKDEDLDAFAQEQHAQILEKILQKIGKKSGRNKNKLFSRINSVMADGSPATVIHNEIIGSKASLLVMGTHGKPRMVTGILGSIARDMVNNARCDVMLVR